EGALPVGGTVTVTLTAEDAGGAPVPGVPVDLSFATGPGGTAVGHGALSPIKGVPLTATPQLFTTFPTGQLTIAYTAAPTLPSGGTDTLTASLDGKGLIGIGSIGSVGPPGGGPPGGGSVAATDSYSYADFPVVTVPGGPLTTNENAPLTFSAAT